MCAPGAQGNRLPATRWWHCAMIQMEHVSVCSTAACHSDKTVVTLKHHQLQICWHSLPNSMTHARSTGIWWACDSSHIAMRAKRQATQATRQAMIEEHNNAVERSGRIEHTHLVGDKVTCAKHSVLRKLAAPEKGGLF